MFDLPVSSFDRCPGKCRADPSALRRKTDFTRSCAADQPPLFDRPRFEETSGRGAAARVTGGDHRHAEPDDLGQESPPSGALVITQVLAR